ncbi:MAG: hypothetical protein E7551_06105 [Ruminococcaceae bacterium]|nr:hypothetical protein [Oscillospiraceae bacterium]
MNFFDLHADTPLILCENNRDSSAVDIVNHPFKKYNQVMAVFLRDDDKNAFESYNRKTLILKQYLKGCAFPLISNLPIKSSGALLSVENAGFLAEDINRIYTLKKDGVVMLSLTWNGDNALASGANGSGGITALGKDVILEMNRLGIALDISHLNHKAAIQGIELADKVLASHSGIYALNPHQRNLKTEALLKLKEKQGIVGICFYPLFLGTDDVFKSIIHSAEFLISLGMENNIAFGSDFDGADMSPLLSKTAHIPELSKAFCSVGFKKSTIHKIFYENAIAFFSKICENK